MIVVKIFGHLREKTRIKSLEFAQAKTVAQVIDLCVAELSKKSFSAAKTEDENNVINSADIRECVIFVNELSIDKLRMFKTPLKDGDTVSFLSQSCGG